MLRLFAIVFLFAGVWLGTKIERTLITGRCEAAGGEMDTRGLCRGLER